MVRFLILPVLLVAGCVAINAPGQGGGLDGSGRGAPAPLVYASAGTELVLANVVDGQRSEARITVASAAGLRGVFTRADGTTGAVYPGCWGCGGQMQIEEQLYGALWPLETGKQVTFLRRAPDGSSARAVIRVAGTEVVQTLAGAIETYRLDGRLESLTGARYTADVKAWWAPDPGWVVKAVGSDSTGRSLSSEVTGIKRP